MLDERAELYNQIAQRAQAATGARVVALVGYEHSTGARHLLGYASGGVAGGRGMEVARGLMPGFEPRRLRLPDLQDEHFAAAYQSGVPQLVPYRDGAEAFVDQHPIGIAERLLGVRYAYVCPLLAHGGVLGSLSFHVAEPPDERQRLVCDAFAAQAAFTLENAQLSAEARDHERLCGALLVARTAAHEINNALAPIAGFADLLAADAEEGRTQRLKTYATLIAESALEAAAKVQRLQALVRLVEAPSPLGVDRPVLDLEQSVLPDDAATWKA